MRTIRIFSHQAARRFLETEEEGKSYSVLLISNPRDSTPNIEYIRANATTLMYIQFDDVVLPRKTLVPATITDVRNMLDWAKEKPRLIVSCGAGVSRSAAVAYLIYCLDEPPAEAIKHLGLGVHDPNKNIVKLGATLLQNPEIEKVASKFNEESLSICYG